MITAWLSENGFYEEEENEGKVWKVCQGPLQAAVLPLLPSFGSHMDSGLSIYINTEEDKVNVDKFLTNLAVAEIKEEIRMAALRVQEERKTKFANKQNSKDK